MQMRLLLQHHLSTTSELAILLVLVDYTHLSELTTLILLVDYTHLSELTTPILGVDHTRMLTTLILVD